MPHVRKCMVGDPAGPHHTYPLPFFFFFFSSFLFFPPLVQPLPRSLYLPLPCTSLLLPCCSGDAPAPATPQAISSFKLHIYYTNKTELVSIVSLISFSVFLVFFLLLIYYKLYIILSATIFFSFSFMIVFVVLVRLLIVE
jgi:hypothetical protein